MRARIKEMLRRQHAVFVNWSRNAALRKECPDFAFPPIELMMETQAHWSYQKFYDSGRESAEIYITFIKTYFDEDVPLRILDWGCGPARIIRHVANAIGARAQYWATDYDEAMITWCRENITGIEFTQNQLEPPLTFADDFFDLIYCRSVFTHLSINLGQRWLAELSRCAKPDGLVSFTTAGYGHSERLTAEERKTFDKGQPVVRKSDTEGGRSFAIFHPPRYIEHIFVADHKIEERILFENPATTQDVWLIRPKAR